MHVAIIIDEGRLRQEHAMLNRIIVGLIGEGMQITRIVPDSVDEADSDEQRIALAQRVTVPMHVLPWMRRPRVRQIITTMERQPPDVVYAVGTESWPLAIDLATALDRPLAIEVASTHQLRALTRRRVRTKAAAYVAPTAAMAEILRSRVAPELVTLAPLGVSVPPQARVVLKAPDTAIALAVIGGGRDVPAYRGVLTALSRLVADAPQIQIVLELRGPRQHEIWQIARQLELLAHLSTLEDAASYRALLTRCDVMIQPETDGEVRSLLLEAMASGLPVVAGAHRALDLLRDGDTASVVVGQDPEAWTQRLRDLVEHPDEARRLGLAGRECVAQQHRSSTQCAALYQTFEAMRSGGAYPFSARSATG